MIRKRLLAVAVVLLVAAAVVAVWTGHSRPTTITIADQLLHVPRGWHVEAKLDSTGITSFAEESSGDRPAATLNLLDERRKPEDSTNFVQQMESAAGTHQLHPLSTTQFRDQAVDESRLRCVAVADNKVVPLMIYCVTQSGRWRIVLAGQNSDVGGLDQLASQIHLLEDK